MTASRRTEGTAESRAALTLQLVPYLVARERAAVADVAADFGIPAAQVREMVRALTTVGLPGERGYWQMPNDLFDIDWDLLEQQDVISLTHVVALERAPRLTAREAAALLAGLQLARAMPGVVDDDVANTLLAKLSRGAATTPPDVVVASEPVDDVRIRVQDALRRGMAVAFTYRAPDAPPTTRTVDPLEIVIADGQWYLRGWCHLRRAVRTFLMDRMVDVSTTSTPSGHRPESGGALFHDDADRTVLLRFPRAAVPLLGGYLGAVDIVTDGDVCTARVAVAGVNTMKRLVARMGGAVEIVLPEDARRAAAAWADAALALYNV